MDVTHGMNVEEVDALGRLLLQSGDRLRGLVGDVDQLVYAADWSGDDGTGFVQTWPTHKGRLLAAADGIGQLGQAAIGDVAEQVLASGGLVAGGTAGAGVGIGASAHATGGLGGGGGGGSWGSSDVERVWETVSGLAAAGTVAQFAVLRSLVGEARALQLVDDMPFAPRGFDYLGIGVDAWNAYQNLEAGNAAGFYHLAHGVAGAVGTVYVPAALVLASWDTGLFIGNQLDEQFQISDRASTAIVDEAINDLYGGEMTVEEADEFSHRYDGIRGVGNFAGDSLKALF